MSKFERNVVMAACVYCVVFMVTFGYSWWRVPSDYPVGKGLWATLCSMAWPLYWSVQLMEPKP